MRPVAHISIALATLLAVVAALTGTGRLLPIVLLPALASYLALVWILRPAAETASSPATNPLGRPARVYLALIMAAAIALAAPLLGHLRALDTRQMLLAVAMTACMMIAFLYPIDLGISGMKLTLDTGVIFAAILLFDPGVAMLVAGCGALVAQSVRRTDRVQTLFNVAQTMLQAAAGGLLLGVGGWEPGRVLLTDPRAGVLAALVAAALAMYLVNTALVALVIALDRGLHPLEVWQDITSRADIVERGVQYALGLGGALAIDAYTSVMPLLMLPAATLYLGVRLRVYLRTNRATIRGIVAGAVRRRFARLWPMPVRHDPHRVV